MLNEKLCTLCLFVAIFRVLLSMYSAVNSVRSNSSKKLNLNSPTLMMTTGSIPQLSTNHPQLVRGVQVTVRAPESSAQPSAASVSRPVLDFIASSETLDRYDEILLASGWRLEHYRRNPVFQNAHQYGDVLHTLGKALITEVRSGPSTINSQPSTFLYQRIEFAVDVNPVARIAYGLYRGGFLNAVSVGFIPIRWVDGDAKSNFRRKYLEQELLEVSAVGIPANPDALQLGLEAGAVQKGDLLETLERTKEILSRLRALGAPATLPASGSELQLATPAGMPAPPEAQLLELARALSQILKRA